MSIDKDGKDYTLYCDMCADPTYTTDDYNDAVEYKKAHGWKSRKEGDDWVDICPECQEGYICRI